MSQKHHGTKRGYRHQEPLYDTNVATPSHAERARTLASSVGTATLSTLTQANDDSLFAGDGFPYGSFVTYGLEDGNPIFLISTLAEHTKNLKVDRRASLLIAEPGEGDPLARSRVTLVGNVEQLDESNNQQAREAFLEAHPGASYYADFKDFSFWRLNVDAIRYIGGYGRMSWVPADDWQVSAPCPVAKFAEKIVTHMNEDHLDTMVLYCKAFSKAVNAEEATMSSVDRYGFEMSVKTEHGPRPVRLAFSKQVSDPQEVRKELVALANSARQQLSIPS